MKNKIKPEQLRLYVITDSQFVDEKLEQKNTLYHMVEQALKGGATFVQYREKKLSPEQMKKEAIELKNLCHKFQVPFIINDYVELAKEIEADGVHVGQEDCSVENARKILGEKFIIGATAKTIEQAQKAVEQGADYLGSGAVFGSTTKKNAISMSKEQLSDICHAVSIPVVGIGGITIDNVDQLAGCGISGIAVISGVFDTNDVKSRAMELKKAVEQGIGKTMKTALTIAGSDCSGGAGIQADLKTMLAHHVYGMSAITALTAQNTTGVKAVMEVSEQFLEEQLDCIFTDIYPDAVKTGMVSSSPLIKIIVKKLKQYQAKNIIVDPVMVATSGARLIEHEAIETLTKELLPIATLVTPNIPEAELLADMKINNIEDMKQAAKKIYHSYHCAVLVKGGHSVGDANDVLFGYHNDANEECICFRTSRIDNPNTHGTGCTLSSAIASNLALGKSLPNAIEDAKRYISAALETGLNLGKGSGPLDHGWKLIQHCENGFGE